MAADSTLGPGFRFHPTDEELVFYYLKRRVDGKPLRFDPIAVIDVYKSEPWDLPGKSKLHTKDLEWYFFSYLETKYGSGWRSNRATQQGYWKTTGKDRVVRRGDKVVGMKKTLVFHIGRAPRGERTNWVMHEYRLVDFELGRQTTFVLCRVFEKSGSGSKNGEQYGAPFVEDEWEDADDDKKALQNKSIDPEEVVADKCNALCTSTDERNPQPSEEELMMHDVKALSLSNVIDDITAGFKGITVRCNGKEIQKSTDIPKLEASRIEGNTNEVENIDVLELSSDGKPSYRVDNGDLKISLVEQNGKMNFDKVVETQKDQPSQVKKECVSADEKTLSRPTSDSCEDEDGTDRIFISKVEEKDKLKSADYFYLSDGTPFKKARAVSLVNQLEEANIKPLAVKSDKSENIIQKKSMVDCDDGNLKASGTAGSAYEAKTKSDLVKDSLKTVNSDGTTSTLLNGTFSESATLPENSLKTDEDIWETTQSESLADSTLGPGFRFHPTDVELVLYYLKRRVTGKPLRFDPISVIDIYKSEPWDLPGQSKLHTTKYLEGYFFSSLETKYDYGWRINRATQHGYWKPTGKDRVVRHVERAVGMKKTLVFHTGRAPRGERTDWVMHEYRLVQEELEKVGLKQATFVLCRVFEKSGPGGKNTEKCGVQMVENELKDGHVLYSKREDNDEKNHQHLSAVQEADPGMCTSVCTSSQSHNPQPQCIAECSSSQSHNPQPQCIVECTSSESHNLQPQCIAVCTSPQSHKPQPSEEESGVGDSVIFPRYLAHGDGVQKSCDTPELDASKKEGTLKNLASFEVLQLSLDDKPGDQVAKEDFKASLVEHGQYSRINLVSDKVSETNTAHSVSIKECVSADVKILERPTYDLPKHEDKRGRISTSTAEEQDKFKFANDLGISDGRPSKKAKLDSSVKQIEETSISKVEVKDKLKSANGKLKFANDFGLSDGSPSKKAKLDSSVKQIEETSISKVEVKDMLKSANDFGLSDGRPSKKPSLDNLVKQVEEANFPPLEVEKEKGEEVARKDKSGIVVQNKSTVDCDRYNIKAPGKSGIASKDKIKSKLVQDLLKMVSSDEKKSRVSNSKVFQDAAASRKNLRPGGKTVEITKRQETDSKEFLSYRGRGKPATIGVKRVVEVNERGFREPCFKNFSSEERDVKAAEIMLLMSGRKTEFRMASHQNC